MKAKKSKDNKNTLSIRIKKIIYIQIRLIF